MPNACKSPTKRMYSEEERILQRKSHEQEERVLLERISHQQAGDPREGFEVVQDGDTFLVRNPNNGHEVPAPGYIVAERLARLFNGEVIRAAGKKYDTDDHAARVKAAFEEAAEEGLITLMIEGGLFD